MTDNGWAEYKHLLLAERDANIAFRKDTRASLEDIRREVAIIKAQRALGAWVLGVAVPAVVAVVVAAGARALGL